jgi:hypothetical protein
MAEWTRSRASETALSGSPTMVNAGIPGATCTCTSTGRTSTPSNDTWRRAGPCPTLPSTHSSGRSPVRYWPLMPKNLGIQSDRGHSPFQKGPLGYARRACIARGSYAGPERTTNAGRSPKDTELVDRPLEDSGGLSGLQDIGMDGGRVRRYVVSRCIRRLCVGNSCLSNDPSRLHFLFSYNAFQCGLYGGHDRVRCNQTVCSSAYRSQDRVVRCQISLPLAIFLLAQQCALSTWGAS